MFTYAKVKYLHKLKTINDLETKLLLENIKPRRSEINILIIDDEASYIGEPLSNLGYTNVTLKSDFPPINLEDFQLIMCDIVNVGKEIHAKNQGFAVYSQIKKTYPNKIIAFYTAHNPSDYGELADDTIIINKPIQPSDLADKIDQITERYWNPKEAWRYISNLSAKKGAHYKDLAVLEDLFVRSFTNKSNLFEKVAKKYKNSHEMYDYLTSGKTLISSLLNIFKTFL